MDATHLNMCEKETLVSMILELRKDSDALNKMLSDYDCDDTDELCEQIDTWAHTHERFEDGDIMERDIFLEQLEDEGKAVYTRDDIETLKEENESLKKLEEEVTDALWDESTPEANIPKLVSDIHKLRNENEKLKVVQQSELLDDAVRVASCHKEQNDILYDENKKLKAQNESLIDENKNMTCVLTAQDFHNQSQEKELIKLKEENESLTHTVKEQSRILNLTSGHYITNEQDKAIFDDMITQAKLDKRFRSR